MNQRKARLAGLFISLMTISTLSHPGTEQETDNKAPERSMEEAFIGLRIGEGGNEFYRIMVDGNEDPYIEINAFLTHLLGLKTDCNPDRLFCSLVLPGETTPRWIDGSNLRMLDAQSKKEIDMRPNSLIRKDDSMWLHYQALEQWLPLRAAWSLTSYEMSINPFFKLPREILDRHLANRQYDLDQKTKRNNRLLDADIEVPESGNQFYEARGEISTSVSSSHRPEHGLSFEVGADLLRGRLQAGGLASSENVDPLQYWQYERFNNAVGDYLAIGQVLYEGTLAHQSQVLQDGYRLKRHYEKEGLGSFSLDATVPGEAVVDIYRNGFYEDTLVADKLGKIVLQDIKASSGDIITLRSISKEGIESKQRFKISGVANQYLEDNDWDYEITGGSNDNGSIDALSFRYGVSPNLTTGLTLKHTSNNEGNQDSETTAMASLAFRPHHRVSFQWQQDLTANSWAYSTDLSLWDGHDLRFFGHHRSDSSSDFGVSDLSPSSHGLEHKWGSHRLQAHTRLVDSHNKTSLKERLGLKIQNNWDVHVEGERAWHKITKNRYDTWQLRNIYSLSNGTKFEAGVIGANDTLRWFGKLRWLGDTEAPWSNRSGNHRFSFNAGIQASNDVVDPEIGLKWHHGNALSGSVHLNKERINAEIQWRFGFAKKTGQHQTSWHRQSWDHFRKGTVHGRLMTPATETSESRPIPDTGIRFSNYQAKTDEQGYFKAEGLPVNQTVKARVDIGSLAIDLMPEKEAWDIRLRPGTVLEFNPEMVWSVGIDGFVDKHSYQPGVQLAFRHKTLGLLSTVTTEPDGFFISERLAPGQYTVDLLYPDAEIKSTSLNIPSDQSWLSDVSLDINNQK